jgi:hypothetical protein
MNHKESAAQHTHEPWLVSARQDEPRQRKIGTGEEGWLGVALVFGDTEEEADANGRRLVACVNACAGIPTEALECQTKKELTKKLIDTNKELLAALEEMEREYGKLHDGLSDMLGDEEGEQRLFEEAIPDDYQWLVGRLVDLVGVANRCNETIKKAKEVFNDL